MWIVIGILLIGVIVSLFEIPSLVKKKWWKEIIVYFILLLGGMTLAILISKGVTIPTPIDLLTKIYSPVTSFIEKVLS